MDKQILFILIENMSFYRTWNLSLKKFRIFIFSKDVSYIQKILYC